MAEWEHALNAYEVLGLAQGSKATDAEIGKAYRAAALRHHPDKNKGDVEGAKAKFQAAKDARDLLSDAKARAALDALLGARAAREAKFAGQDEKRRKMRETLERNEKAAATGRSEEAEARTRLQAELGRLKREAAARRAAQQAAQQAAQPARPAAAGATADSAGQNAAPAADAPPVITEDLLRTLKAGAYTSQQLRDAFAAHGPVEDVILRGSKKKSKGSALVVMGTRAGAAAAAATSHGDPANALLVVPFLKVPAVQPANGVAEPAQASAAGAPDAWAPPVANGHVAAAAAAAPAAADSDTTDSRQPAGAAALLFPLDDAVAAGIPAVDGLAASQQQAPLFPSFDAAGAAAGLAADRLQAPLFPGFDGTGGAAVAARPATSRGSGPAGANGAAAPLPTASSFRPPPSGLFNAGLYSAAPRMPPTAGVAAVPAAEPDMQYGDDAANGTPAAAEAAAGGAKAAQAPQHSASQHAPLPKVPLPGRPGASTDRTFETPAQADLRRAAERARLIAEMEAEDAAEGA